MLERLAMVTSRRLIASWTVWLACVLAGCGGSSPPASPAAPSAPTTGSDPAPAPTVTRYSLSGAIVERGTESPPRAARVAILDGANLGKSAGTDAAGRYRIDELDPGTFLIQATADEMEPETRSVTLSANQTADFGLKRIASPAGPAVEGRTVDGLTERPLGGVTIKVDGVGESTTNPDGTFRVEAANPEEVHAVTLSASSIVTRETRLRVPGPAATLSLIPSSFDLMAYDQMFRSSSGELHRWTSAPRVVVVSRVLKFTNIADAEYAALGTVISVGDVNDLLADLRWALPQLTGNAFTAFADEQRESAAEGERVSVSRPGLIVVARYEGLEAATGFWGYTRWAWNGAGELQAGIVMLDNAFETSGNQYRRSLRAHEFGHALGYTHVSPARTSVMNPDARTEPNAFDRDGAKIAFQRPPLNRSPDIDPDPFTGNLRALGGLFWKGDR